MQGFLVPEVPLMKKSAALLLSLLLAALLALNVQQRNVLGYAGNFLRSLRHHCGVVERVVGEHALVILLKTALAVLVTLLAGKRPARN